MLSACECSPSELQMERVGIGSQKLSGNAQLRAEFGTAGADAFERRVFLNDDGRHVFQLVVRVDQEKRQPFIQRRGT